MRTSKTEIQAAFLELTKLIGSHDWELDYQPAYGGWAITSHNRSVYPYGSLLSAGRMQGKQFLSNLRFAIKTLEICHDYIRNESSFQRRIITRTLLEAAPQ